MTQRFNPPAARRLSAVAIAAALAVLAGTAAAQSQSGYVTDSRGTVVRNSHGECVRPGMGAAPTAPCPPAATAQRVADSPRAQAARPAAATGATAAGPSPASGSGAAAPANMPGYAVSSDGRVVLSGFGQCVRAGHWTPQNAAEPCDRIAVANVPPPPVVAEAPKPPEVKPEPAPLAQPAPAPEPRPVIQKVTLATDVLFDFNKAELKESGKRKLDELISQVKDANVDEVVAIGHADRIASEEYNQKLSEERAQAVKAYLEEKMAGKAQRVTAEGKGESQPVTGEDCKKMGAERAANRKLVACLQPDRRVEIEVLGTRQLAGTEAPAAGATGAPAGGGATAR